MDRTTSTTMSRSPTDEPPENTTKSFAMPRRSAARNVESRSDRRPRRTGTPPLARTTLAIVFELISYTWPARIGSPGGTISSPVVRIETRGCAYARAPATPIAARAPTFAGVNNSPARTTIEPRLMSAPRATTCWPAWTAATIFTTFPSRSVSSNRTTAFAPAGTVDPVESCPHEGPRAAAIPSAGIPLRGLCRGRRPRTRPSRRGRREAHRSSTARPPRRPDPRPREEPRSPFVRWDGRGPSRFASRPRRKSAFSVGASHARRVHAASACGPLLASSPPYSDCIAQLRQDHLLHRQATCIRGSRETEHDPAVVYARGRARQHRRTADLLVR